MRLIIASILCLTLFASCTKSDVVNLIIDNVNDIEEVSVNADRESLGAQTTAIIDPLRIRAEEIASSLDDSLLASQVLISGIDGRGSLPLHVSQMLKNIPAGGVMLFRYNLNTSNEEIKNLLSETASLITENSNIPPFIAVDHEGRYVNRFLPGVADLPDASSYWNILQEEGREAALSKIEEDSFKAASIINELGINMNFAPVAEYLNDDNRDFLVHRSYGSDPFFTALAAGAFLQSMQKAGIICVVKHFPGTAGADPHYWVSVINGEKNEIDMLVFPFIYLINNGARAIMAAHSLVPLLDQRIASLSPAVMQDLLRGDLGFDGIIISDDFSMAAAGDFNKYEAAVQSIAAGADLILVWPPDLAHTHSAILSALEEGELSRNRLQDAVQRIIYEKLRMGLME
ncbi:MAG: glycoside hydrolase family 3 protein [Treponema sp.]|nr:glycoside hydrolase family 3 protein [Treponema sp.]